MLGACSYCTVMLLLQLTPGLMNERTTLGASCSLHVAERCMATPCDVLNLCLCILVYSQYRSSPCCCLLLQAGVSVTAWVLGHQIFDMVGLMLHPMLFFAWIYVLTLTPVPQWSYFTTLVAVGFYTSGLGYLVRAYAKPEVAQQGTLGDVRNGWCACFLQL